jgi:hypothetical protein
MVEARRKIRASATEFTNPRRSSLTKNSTRRGSDDENWQRQQRQGSYMLALPEVRMAATKQEGAGLGDPCPMHNREFSVSLKDRRESSRTLLRTQC